MLASEPGPGIPTWTLGLLKARIVAVFDTEMSLEAVWCMVRALGFRKMSARPLHPKADRQRWVEFRREFSRLAADSLPDNVSPGDVLVCFQDEARIGQKGMLIRVWACRGVRLRVPRDYRYGYCYLFSAICPETGGATGHVCDKATAEGHHALVILDGAGWHRSKVLEIPGNVSLQRLPPYSPELNPVETSVSVSQGETSCQPGLRHGQNGQEAGRRSPGGLCRIAGAGPLHRSSIMGTSCTRFHACKSGSCTWVKPFRDWYSQLRKFSSGLDPGDPLTGNS